MRALKMTRRRGIAPLIAGLIAVAVVAAVWTGGRSTAQTPPGCVSPGGAAAAEEAPAPTAALPAAPARQSVRAPATGNGGYLPGARPARRWQAGCETPAATATTPVPAPTATAPIATASAAVPGAPSYNGGSGGNITLPGGSFY